MPPKVSRQRDVKQTRPKGTIPIQHLFQVDAFFLQLNVMSNFSHSKFESLWPGNYGSTRPSLLSSLKQMTIAHDLKLDIRKVEVGVFMLLKLQQNFDPVEELFDVEVLRILLIAIFDLANIPPLWDVRFGFNQLQILQVGKERQKRECIVEKVVEQNVLVQRLLSDPFQE
jgi:hypothetical protein